MSHAPPPREPAAEQVPMGLLNGALRFLLELTALTGIVVGGAALLAGPAGWVVGAATAAAGAAAWGRWRVDGDPGPAPVPVPGPCRLALELAVLIAGGIGLALAFEPWVWVTYATATMVHHIAAVPRLRWLLSR